MTKADSANSPLALTTFNWGGPGYPTYDGLASAAAVASPATEGAGTGTAETGAQGGTGSSAATGTETQPGTSSQPNPNDVNLKTLRENHDRYKSEVEKYGTLGKFEQVQAATAYYTKIVGEIQTLGKRLGYSDTDVAEAIAHDPAKALLFLQREATAAQADPHARNRAALQEEIDKRVGEKLKPFEQERNRQIADQANQAFNGEVNRIIDTKFKGVEAMPPELREPFIEVVSEFMSFADPKDIEALRKGDVSVVERTFNDALNFITKLGAGYIKWENSRRGAAGANQGAGNGAGAGKPKFTLDDIINGNEKAKALKSFQ